MGTQPVEALDMEAVLQGGGESKVGHQEVQKQDPPSPRGVQVEREGKFRWTTGSTSPAEALRILARDFILDEAQALIQKRWILCLHKNCYRHGQNLDRFG